MSLYNPLANTANPSFLWLILVTGFGFFIDSFDAFSYNVMRTPSLTELGLSGDDLTRAGMIILNWQVFGILLGGFFWGLLGDKVGRKKALLGSILLYSLAMLANAFVHDITLYTVLRFFVGFGIAGEVGLAAALVGETLPKDKRTYGLTFLTILGLLGVTAAAASIEFFHWRTLCLIGGVAGLVLLVLRHLLLESPLFLAVQTSESFMLPLKTIFTSRLHLRRYIACILILAPSFLVTGVIMTLSPEIAKAMNATAPVKANIMIGSYFTVAVLGDLCGAYLTQKLYSRKTAAALFMAGNLIMILVFLHTLVMPSTFGFYMTGALLGMFNVWALSATISVEQFPTHLRATATTSVLTFARGIVILFNAAVLMLKSDLGLINALTLIAVVIFSMGLIVVCLMRETYHADLAAIDA